MSVLVPPQSSCEDLAATIRCQIASDRAERSSCFRLVYNAYIGAGLIERNAFGMRVTPYHLLDSTQVFLATSDGKPMFTMSLVIDGELGLPLECIYPEEIEQRRADGMKLVEVSCLADRRTGERGFFLTLLKVSHFMAHFAKSQGVDEAVIAVHPKHARFYQRVLDFQPIGPLRSYPNVRNRPAVALSLNFARVEVENPRAYALLFADTIPEDELAPSFLSDEDREYFSQMVDDGYLVPLGDEDALMCA